MSSIVSQTPCETSRREGSSLGLGIVGTALTLASLVGAHIEAGPPLSTSADDSTPQLSPHSPPANDLTTPSSIATENRPKGPISVLPVSTLSPSSPFSRTLNPDTDLNDLSLPPRPSLHPDRPVALFGGGPLPKLGVELFSKWVGGGDGELLVILWGSNIPDQYFADISKAFQQAGLGKVTRMPNLSDALDAMRRSSGDSLDPNDPRLLLKRASGVFLAGGNQNKLYDGFLKTNLEEPLIRRIENNTLPVAGTSAGTAIMSQHMICGSGQIDESWPGQNYTQRSLSYVGRGLSVLPQIVTDQHFDTRKRLGRLHEVLKEAPPEIRYAVGVDESAGGFVVQKRYVMATGPGAVTVLVRNADGSCAAPRIINAGKRFDLHTGQLEDVKEPTHSVEAFERLASVP